MQHRLGGIFTSAGSSAGEREELVLEQKFFLSPKENWLIQAFTDPLDYSKKFNQISNWYPIPLHQTIYNLPHYMERVLCQV